MSNFTDALAALAALDVPGVADNFGIARTPAQPDRSQLPALIVMPTERADRLFAARGEGLAALTFANSSATYTSTVTHLLLIAPHDSALGVRSHYGLLAALIDGYFAALHANLLLDGALAHPPHVQVDSGLIEYGGVRYIGAAFRHLWTLEVA
jgi:hypothetical protein